MFLGFGFEPIIKGNKGTGTGYFLDFEYFSLNELHYVVVYF